MRTHSLLVAFAALGLAITAARAQSDYPNNTVRIVVDSAPGSANDSTSRVLGDRLSKVWNQPVVTLNQPGAGAGRQLHALHAVDLGVLGLARRAWGCAQHAGRTAARLRIDLVHRGAAAL